MNEFTFRSVSSAREALATHTAASGSMYLGGGTNLLDNWKLGIEQPAHLVDVRHIGTSEVLRQPDQSLRIGGGVTNTAVAYDPAVRHVYPALSEALLAGASPQLRNAATVAGNLLQRTRCSYFRDISQPCNKRVPGSGCPAIPGINRSHALLGTSRSCIATHPSDMSVALLIFDASIHTKQRTGARSIPIADFFVPYGEDPARENLLENGELVLYVHLPHQPWTWRSSYVKARDRASYEFALASAATALDLEDEIIRDCRVALGGVATKPWRAHAAEAILRGQKPSEELFEAAAAAELKAAIVQKHNGFKVPLAKRVMMQALRLNLSRRKAAERISHG